MIGNTFGYDCATGTPLPIVGSVGACGSNTTDSAPDVFWRSDSPTGGQAQANTGITAAQARSTAVLTLPSGAQVTHAYLYWAATLSTPSSDPTAILERPGVFSAPVTALQTLTGANNSYRSVADVTSMVQGYGAGAYRLSDVAIGDWVNQNNSNAFGAWWMVILYRLDSEPLRYLALYDGLDYVSIGSPQSVTLSGFQTPSSGREGLLGVAALEGDNTVTGDTLAFGAAILSNALNPINNFFNGTRSKLGASAFTAGDLPQLTGGGQSTSGLDLDVIDVTSYLTSGQTSVQITASTSGDDYALGTLVLSIVTTPTLTATTLVSFPNPSAIGASVTFTATVAPTPTGGTVAFKDNGTDIADCTAQTVTSGQATCATAALTSGAHTITAFYSGDASYSPSDNTASPLTQTVNSPSAVTLSSFNAHAPSFDLGAWFAHMFGLAR
jgi:hypothetical protein